MLPSQQVGHAWRPIEGLADAYGLAVPELRAFTRVWQRQRRWLEGQGALEVFQERLARRWSIETGVIERLYDLSRGATETLVRQGFVASLVAHGDATIDADELIDILDDHRGGLAMTMDLTTGTRPLSLGWIKELHALLTRHQTHASGRVVDGQRTQIPLLRGAFKVQPNSPRRPDGLLHEHCPPEQVVSELEPERYERDTLYSPALEQADQGDLRPLVELTARSMIRSLRDALASRPASPIGTQRAITAARSKIQARRAARDQRALVMERLHRLAGVVSAQLQDSAMTLFAAIPDLPLAFSCEENNPEFFQPVRQLAEQGGYVPDFGEPYIVCSWTLESTRTGEISIVLQPIGCPSSGAAIANLMTELRPANTPRSPSAITGMAGVEPLLLAIDENVPEQVVRMEIWLDVALGRALDPWTDLL